MIKIYYSIAQYIPSDFRDERINIGLAVHCPHYNYSHFYKTSKLSRIRQFDDEFDKDYLELIFESLEFQLNSNTIQDEGTELEFQHISNVDFLESVTMYYTNEIRFTPIKVLLSSQSDFQKDIDNLKDALLYYDKTKSERITQDQVRNLVARTLTDYKKTYSKASIKNDIGENIFDFTLEDLSRETYIKALTFDFQREHSKKPILDIKATMFDINNIKTNWNSAKIFFVVNNTKFEKSYEKDALNTIKSSNNDFHMQIKTISEFEYDIKNNTL
ncbi:DUF3037 domain-containing protein [Listeria booriae]|uniref:DUF3037 domain-containing protein n=1 Tax=Listeria booriae TaxID=1552123 RepID=UPI00164D04D8|nr:DUF3037 domain-containing protein [Listeria booriae]MBC6165201.1 DUF3037 domain-containing protein [Listeria booriae]